MMAGATRPLGLIEGNDATAEFDLAGLALLEHICTGIAVGDRDAGAGTALRAGGICFGISHDSVLRPCNDRGGHVPRAEGQPTSLASIYNPPCKLSINSAAIINPLSMR